MDLESQISDADNALQPWNANDALRVAMSKTGAYVPYIVVLGQILSAQALHTTEAGEKDLRRPFAP